MIDNLVLLNFGLPYIAASWQLMKKNCAETEKNSGPTPLTRSPDHAGSPVTRKGVMSLSRDGDALVQGLGSGHYCK